MPDRQIVETFPYFEIDGVELTEDQSREYEELLQDCGGDTTLCQEVWSLYHFNDGDQWYTMDMVQHLDHQQDLDGENDLDFEDDED